MASARSAQHADGFFVDLDGLLLPAMHAMAQTLGVDAGMVEFTVSGYLIGFSFGQLFWGPISDRYGRRLPIAVGLVLFVIGSAGYAMSGSVTAIIAWRVLQAIGACASVVLARAMVRNLYQGNRAAQMLSTIIAVMAIAPLLGPSLGGQIAALAGWRAIFWALVGVGVITLAALFTVPETLSKANRRHEPLSGAFARYGKLLRHRKILSYTGAGGFFYAGMYAYIAGSPFAYINYHRVPAQYYGLLFGVGFIGIITANLLNTRLVPKFGTDRVLVGGTMSAAAAAVVLAIAAFTGWFGIWGLFVPLLVYVSSAGFIIANSIAGALADHPTEAGAVSALVGALQYGSGIAGSGLVGLFADGTPWTMGWVIAATALGSLLCIRLIGIAR